MDVEADPNPTTPSSAPAPIRSLGSAPIVAERAPAEARRLLVIAEDRLGAYPKECLAIRR